jgi:hypothetical protein
MSHHTDIFAKTLGPVPPNSFVLKRFDLLLFSLNLSEFSPDPIDPLLSRLLLVFTFISFSPFLERNSHHPGDTFGPLFLKTGTLAIPPSLL